MPGELERAAAAMSGGGPIVIDPSALATLFFSGQYEQLHLLAGRCIIFETALEEYTELRQKFFGGSSGFIGKLKGKYHFREDDPAERERQVRRLDKFLSVIRTLATMKSGESLANLPAEQREELIRLFGQPAAAAIAEAKAIGGSCGPTTSPWPRSRQSVGVEKRVWTQAVFKPVAPPDIFAELTIFLLHWRYFFTWLEPKLSLPPAARHRGIRTPLPCCGSSTG